MLCRKYQFVAHPLCKKPIFVAHLKSPRPACRHLPPLDHRRAPHGVRDATATRECGAVRRGGSQAANAVRPPAFSRPMDRAIGPRRPPRATRSSPGAMWALWGGVLRCSTVLARELVDASAPRPLAFFELAFWPATVASRRHVPCAPGRRSPACDAFPLRTSAAATALRPLAFSGRTDAAVAAARRSNRRRAARGRALERRPTAFRPQTLAAGERAINSAFVRRPDSRAPQCNRWPTYLGYQTLDQSIFDSKQNDRPFLPRGYSRSGHARPGGLRHGDPASCRSENSLNTKGSRKRYRPFLKGTGTAFDALPKNLIAIERLLLYSLVFRGHNGSSVFSFFPIQPDGSGTKRSVVLAHEVHVKLAR